MANSGLRPRCRRLVLLLFSWLLIVSMVGMVSGAEAQAMLEISARVVPYRTEFVSGDVRIPVLMGLGDSVLEERLNSWWEREITGFAEQIAAEGRAFDEELGEELRHWLPFAAAVDFRVGYLDERFLSIPIEYYYFTGGAHGFSYLESTNVDLLTGEELTLGDLFVAEYDYCEAIHEEVLSQMRANPSIYFDETMADSEVSPNHPFYLTPEGIVVYYGLYEVAPYSSGIPEFTIPYACVWGNLQPAIQAIAAGAQVIP